MRFRYRAQGERRYKRKFIIVAEGTVTEPEYFSIFNEDRIVCVKCLKNDNNLPPEKALKCIQNYVRQEKLKKNDEAWVVVDRDSWKEGHLTALHAWQRERKNYGFALSNPKFEYWLLLHFEDVGANNCDTRLATHIPGYDKHIDRNHFPLDRIREAVKRARRRDTPPCTDWPRSPGITTVYLLIESILGRD